MKQYKSSLTPLFLCALFFLSTPVFCKNIQPPVHTINFENSVAQNKSIRYVGKGNLIKLGNNKVLDASDGGGRLVGIQSINTSRGGISLWVYPKWKPEDSKSQVLLTMPWKDSKSYLALSYGWWEPKGSGRLYFILSNKDHIHCSSSYKFKLNEWSMVSVSWSKKESDYISCEIFVNASVIIKQKKEISKTFLNNTSGQLYLGNDNGALNKKGRIFNGYIDNVNIFNYAPKQRDYINLYNTDSLSKNSYEDATWAWLYARTNDEPIHQPETIKENRIIFDEGIAWAKSKHATDQILHRIKMAGFNVYIPVVWHGKGTYYPSQIAHVDDRLGTVISEYDPLAYLFDKAHEMGVEVHPWVTVVKREDDKLPEYYDHDTPARAYNVRDKKFQMFIIELMMEIVENYPVDGINLDYIRTMGMCFSEQCIKDYKRKYDRNLRADYVLRFVDNEAKERVKNWQEHPVESIVMTFSKLAREKKPNIKISVDMHSQTDDSTKTVQGRNSIKWLKQGWIDYIFDMQYQKSIDYEYLNNFSRKLDDRSRHIVLMANYDKIDKEAIARTGSVVNALVIYNKTKTLNGGVAFYLYSRLSDEQIQSLRNGVFSSSAQTNW